MVSLPTVNETLTCTTMYHDEELALFGPRIVAPSTFRREVLALPRVSHRGLGVIKHCS